MKLDLAICQFRPVKADVEASLAEAARVFERLEAMKPRPEMLVFPETALTGYFLEGGVREHARLAAEPKEIGTVDAACKRLAQVG